MNIIELDLSNLSLYKDKNKFNVEFNKVVTLANQLILHKKYISTKKGPIQTKEELLAFFDKNPMAVVRVYKDLVKPNEDLRVA